MGARSPGCGGAQRGRVVGEGGQPRLMTPITRRTQGGLGVENLSLKSPNALRMKAAWGEEKVFRMLNMVWN